MAITPCRSLLRSRTSRYNDRPTDALSRLPPSHQPPLPGPELPVDGRRDEQLPVGDEHAQTEEAGDPVGEQLVEEPADVQPVIEQRRHGARERQRDAKRQQPGVAPSILQMVRRQQGVER
jgi:hypothetical protein